MIPMIKSGAFHNSITLSCLLILIMLTVDTRLAVADKNTLQTPLLLQAVGRILQDSAGKRIELKGINIEMHNWAYNDSAQYDPDTHLWTIGNEDKVVQDIQNMYKWALLPDDFQKIHEWGANVIRLQLPHYLFESIMNPGDYHDWAFGYLEDWITWAAEQQLYIILDLHVPYGGRQYSCNSDDEDCMEGKTLWKNLNEQTYTKNLWQEIARRTRQHENVLYELINEPYPENSEQSNDDWWTLAQELVEVIRDEGNDQLIIVPNPLPENAFRKINDSKNNTAYDFHFYKPYKFTQQQAAWMSPSYPAASYPYSLGLNYLMQNYDLDDPNFGGSSSWERFEETFSGSEELLSDMAPTHVRLRLCSTNNTSSLSYDDVEFYIDSDGYVIDNADFETGSGDFPDDWEQEGAVGTEAYWVYNDTVENHFITIPKTDNERSRSVKPIYDKLVELPQNFNSITVSSKVLGGNESSTGETTNVFGLEWWKEIFYDQSSMLSDIQSFIDFGINENVPIMCLEFGVIMEADLWQGHGIWLNDFTDLLDKYGIHGAYHVYRGYDDNLENEGFGIYQCWGKLAAECEKKYEFVFDVLEPWINSHDVMPLIPIYFLLLN